jgi:hypothetical protein
MNTMKNDLAIARPNFAILGGGEISVDLAMELMRRWDNHDALLEALRNLAFHAEKFSNLPENASNALRIAKDAIANAEK